MVTQKDLDELKLLEMMDHGFMDKYQNGEEWTEEEKAEEKRVHARINELSEKAGVKISLRVDD
jgi:hypothetical protein